MIVFASPSLGSSIKLSRVTRKRAFHYLAELSDTQSFPYMVTIWRHIAAGLILYDIRNQITSCCSSLVEFCNVNTILSSHAMPLQLKGYHDKIHSSPLRMVTLAYALNHAGDSYCNHRYPATFSHSDIAIILIVTFLRHFVPFI